MFKRSRRRSAPEIVEMSLSSAANAEIYTTEPSSSEPRRSKLWAIGGAMFILVLTIGIFASNGWFPRTDAMSGKKSGWFGKPLPLNATSTWNPLMPSPTPQLSKEYIYAGSRLLAVEDANASAAPPGDLAVWRPSDGKWYVLGGPGSAQTYQLWGQNGDIPAQGDFDGDGKTDFCVFRPSNGKWYIVNSSNGSETYFDFGGSTDIPVVADYDGDGRSDIATWRNSSATFYVFKSSTQSSWYTSFGVSGDVPAPADYDGDGKADITVWRNSSNTFYSLLSSNGQAPQYTFGSSGDKPVSADYDGDGKANYALRSGPSWIIANATNTATATTTPAGDGPTDIPVRNDYDGDGKVDIAVWRPSNGHWYIRKSGSNGALRDEYWGADGDIPVPAYYRR